MLVLLLAFSMQAIGRDGPASHSFSAANSHQDISVLLRPSTSHRGLATLPKKGKQLAGQKTTLKAGASDDVPDYIGTIIVTAEEAQGEALEFQKKIANAFASDDPCPLSRTKHYDWLPHYEAFPVWNLGWRGVIKQVEALDNGSKMVKIRFTPNLYSKILKTLILDEVVETYRVNKDDIKFIESDAAIPNPRCQHFPVHL